MTMDLLSSYRQFPHSNVYLVQDFPSHVWYCLIMFDCWRVIWKITLISNLLFIANGFPNKIQWIVNLRLLSRHWPCNSPLNWPVPTDSDGQIPAVYQRALQLGKSKELATGYDPRGKALERITGEFSAPVWAFVFGLHCCCAFTMLYNFFFHVASIWTSTDS